MSTNILKDHWKEVKVQLKDQWSKLTDHDLSTINGDCDKLSTALEKHYEYTKSQAKTQIEKFKHRYENGDEPTILESLGQAAHRVSHVSQDVFNKTKEVAEHLKHDAGEYGKVVTDFIEKKPYQSLAIAALSGLVLGLLLRKK